MPRTNQRETRDARSSGRGDRPTEGSSPRRPGRNVDEEVVALRQKGNTYASIASAVGLKRAEDARAIFMRALRASPEGVRADMVARESQRLDQLELRIRERDANNPEKLGRRLTALLSLREALP